MTHRIANDFSRYTASKQHIQVDCIFVKSHLSLYIHTYIENIIYNYTYYFHIPNVKEHSTVFTVSVARWATHWSRWVDREAVVVLSTKALQQTLFLSLSFITCVTLDSFSKSY